MLRRLVLSAALLISTGCASSLGAHSIELGNTLTYYNDSQLMVNLPQRDYRGESLAKYIPAMERLIASKGLGLKDLQELPKFIDITEFGLLGLDGYYDEPSRNIFVNTHKNKNLVFATMVHEFGHSVQPMTYGPAGQVYAEALSYLVCKALGEDFTWESFPYILTFEFNQPLQYYSRELDAEVAFIVRKLK